MDFSTITTLVGSLGFPIVACCVMFKMYSDQMTAHSEEVASFTEAINELRLAITELKDKLNKEE